MYKIKEIKLGDTKIERGKKSTVTDIDPVTGGITWDIEDAPDFGTTLDSFNHTKDLLNSLTNTLDEQDETLEKLAAQVNNLFNKFRTHLRKIYPEEYNSIKHLTNEISSTNQGGASFNAGQGMVSQGKSKYKYKLVKKKKLDEDIDSSFNEFQNKRIEIFETLENKLNQIPALLSNAKSETAKHYSENPGSYEIIYGTDMIDNYLNSIIELLNKPENENA